MRYIDLDTWERTEYFEAYSDADFPYINIGANVNVTRLLAFCESRGLSSHIGMVFAAHHTAEAIENFHYRIVEGRPIVNDVMCPSFTHIPEGRDLFVLVTMEFVDDIVGFHERAKAEIAAQGTEYRVKGRRERYDIVMYSAIPWVQYTHFVRTIAKSGVDSNPKISWGKYFQQGERTMVPFSVQVHHGLMDGLHVGRYFEELQRFLDECGE